MANWYGTSRSNYFRVKDRAAFDAWLKTVPDIRVSEADASEDPGREGKIGLFSSGEYGDFPASRYDEDKDDDLPLDLLAELALHLADGEVAVLMTVGAEKERYVTGWAWAVDSKGATVQLSLDDIYDLAKKSLLTGGEIDLATY